MFRLDDRVQTQCVIYFHAHEVSFSFVCLQGLSMAQPVTHKDGARYMGWSAPAYLDSESLITMCAEIIKANWASFCGITTVHKLPRWLDIVTYCNPASHQWYCRGENGKILICLHQHSQIMAMQLSSIFYGLKKSNLACFLISDCEHTNDSNIRLMEKNVLGVKDSRIR